MARRVFAKVTHGGSLSDPDQKEAASKVFQNILQRKSVGSVLVVGKHDTWVEIEGSDSDVDQALNDIDAESWVSGVDPIVNESGVSQELSDQYVSPACEVPNKKTS